MIPRKPHKTAQAAQNIPTVNPKAKRRGVREGLTIKQICAVCEYLRGKKGLRGVQQGMTRNHEMRPLSKTG